MAKSVRSKTRGVATLLLCNDSPRPRQQTFALACLGLPSPRMICRMREQRHLHSSGLMAIAAVFLLVGNSYAEDKRHIVVPGRSDSLPFSDGVLVGKTLYLAGKLGLDPATGKAPADVEQEIRLVMDAVKATLTAADMTMDDLVSVQVFCPDLSLYDKFNEIYRTYFTKNFPARAFIGSGPLLRGGRFEVQGIAVKR